MRKIQPGRTAGHPCDTGPELEYDLVINRAHALDAAIDNLLLAKNIDDAKPAVAFRLCQIHGLHFDFFLTHWYLANIVAQTRKQKFPPPWIRKINTINYQP